MSTISGSCGVSEAQRLFEQGIQEQQNLRLQQNSTLESIQSDKTTSGLSISQSSTLGGQFSVAEPNKGQNIDVYV
ncbi:MAG: hypothetical protein OEX12_02815 [Gammaproteobacteria bacterium]|nr:hypothetical protein [Gammaproteobacteria bacterium]